MGEVISHPSAQPESLRAPEKLTPEHDIGGFDSGVPELDRWLKTRALANEASGASKTYVACVGSRVVGYYCIVAGSVVYEQALSRVRRNMPNPVPVIVIGRLAVDREWQRRGLGRDLMRDAVQRIVDAADIVGIRAILVHAKDDAAKRYYQEKCGFEPSPIEPMTLMVTLADAKQALG